MMTMMHFGMVLLLFPLLDVSVSAFLITTTTKNTVTTNTNAGGGVSTSTLRMSSMDSGWDNDNFLESLSGRNEDGAIDRANEEYFQMSRYGRPEEIDWGDDDVVVVDTQNYNNQQRSPSLSRFGRRPPPPDYDPNHNQYQQQQQQQQEQSPPTHSFPPNNLYTANAYADTNTNANTSPTTSYADSLQQSQQQPPIPTSSYSYNNPDDISDDFVVGREIEENIGTPAAPNNDELPYPEEIAGATFTAEMRTKVKLSHTDQEGASQGGSRFRELMTRAENQQVARRSNPQPTQTITPTMVMTSEEIANLSIDQQARLYREFYHTQQEQQKQHDFSSGGQRQQQQRNSKSIGSTSTNYLQKGIYGFDGKKIGHNKDIDAISNTSDEYFARLKRDSTTRNIARYSGDTNKANDIFHDPSIADINVVVNPYLQESRQRQLDVIETVPEEMLVFQEFDNDTDNSNTRRSEEENKSFSGISYRNRIEQVQEAKRQQQDNSNNNNNNNGATNDNNNNYSNDDDADNNNSNNGW
jgi:hypothetical protein